MLNFPRSQDPSVLSAKNALRTLIFFLLLNLIHSAELLAEDVHYRDFDNRPEEDKLGVDFTVSIPTGFENQSLQSNKVPFWVRRDTASNGSQSISTVSIGAIVSAYPEWKKSQEEIGQGDSPQDYFQALSKIDVGMELVGSRIFSYKGYPAFEGETTSPRVSSKYHYFHQLIRLVLYGDYLIDLGCADFNASNAKNLFDHYRANVCEPFFESLALE
ncbi:MAG: hypothetical protein LBE27_05275 [Deltaproteobacteria bacterium]|jgi:hypothetical protein|nr:hypothetical protein [Deltaproteobacteria bacterium]